MSFSGRELSEAAYEKLADETLDALSDYFEDLADEAFTGTEYDVVFSVRHYNINWSALSINYCRRQKTRWLK